MAAKLDLSLSKPPQWGAGARYAPLHKFMLPHAKLVPAMQTHAGKGVSSSASVEVATMRALLGALGLAEQVHMDLEGSAAWGLGLEGSAAWGLHG